MRTNQTKKPVPQKVRAKELSAELGYSAQTILRCYRQGKISGEKLGHSTVLFDVEEARAEFARFKIQAVGLPKGAR
jgi:hypothetical protein